jgi:hypothetical protein
VDSKEKEPPKEFPPTKYAYCPDNLHFKHKDACLHMACMRFVVCFKHLNLNEFGEANEGLNRGRNKEPDISVNGLRRSKPQTVGDIPDKIISMSSVETTDARLDIEINRPKKKPGTLKKQGTPRVEEPINQGLRRRK